jgi:hypothetical protein
MNPEDMKIRKVPSGQILKELSLSKLDENIQQLQHSIEEAQNQRLFNALTSLQDLHRKLLQYRYRLNNPNSQPRVISVQSVQFSIL